MKDDTCASCGGICTCRRVGEKPLQLALGARLLSTFRRFPFPFPFPYEVSEERGKETEASEATQRSTNDWPEIFVRPRDIHFNSFRGFHENERTLNSTTFQLRTSVPGKTRGAKSTVRIQIGVVVYIGVIV